MERTHNNSIKIIIVGAAGLLAIITLVLILSNIFKSPIEDYYAENIDPYSGETVLTVQEEPEDVMPDPALLGFSIFYDFGFSSTQQNLIFNTVHDYFHNNYPEMKSLSYLKDSFEYDPTNYYKSSFKVVSNDGNEYSVFLDTKGKRNTIDIAINN